MPTEKAVLFLASVEGPLCRADLFGCVGLGLAPWQLQLGLTQPEEVLPRLFSLSTWHSLQNGSSTLDSLPVEGGQPTGHAGGRTRAVALTPSANRVSLKSLGIRRRDEPGAGTPPVGITVL